MPADQPTQTASQRFCAAAGIQHPGPLSDVDAAAFERAQDEADADLDRRYSGSQAA
ncbi:hypothetical protein AB0J14_05160 [Micromonospora arborensis]|uniref:hypothetical protein n=1 Tax=Micromonospora arborensis TaxID=2116518 RepID=UPI00341105D9